MSTFDDLTDAYEAMIDWPKRLAHEEPLYRWLFERTEARRVLDTACGTGHHAAMFQSWGLRVEGADISPVMLEMCRHRAPESESLRWVLRGFEAPMDHPGAFDVTLCIGNSLALAGDEAAAARAVRQMLVATRGGGAVLIHVINLWRLPDGPTQWQKCKRTTLSGIDTLILKGIGRCGNAGYVELLVTDLSQSPPSLQADHVPFLGFTAESLEKMAHDAGARNVDFFADHQRHAYSATKSQDLIVIAWK